MAFFFFFRRVESIGREKSHISAESRETLTAAALLLSENSALSTTLMCHMTLHGDKCHCPLSNRKDDCMSFMVPSGVWVWLYNFRFFFFASFGVLCLGVGSAVRVRLCLRVSLHINHFIYASVSCRRVRLCDLWGEQISYNFLFLLKCLVDQSASSNAESLTLHMQQRQCSFLSSNTER